MTAYEAHAREGRGEDGEPREPRRAQIDTLVKPHSIPPGQPGPLNGRLGDHIADK